MVRKKMDKAREFRIGHTWVGGGSDCFVTAEIGINHDNNFDRAVKLIEVAAKAGCNAVKFQMFRAERMYVEGAGKFKTPDGKLKDIGEIIKSSELAEEWLPKLKRCAKGLGMEMYSSVCDEQSGDVLEKYHMPAYKFASYELTHWPLFAHVAKKGKPVVLSTACAKLQEVAEAVDWLRGEGLDEVIVMHCMGKYPVDLAEVNLAVIETLKLAFPQVVVGYSDHSVHPTKAPVAAVALGAKMVEKHITLDKKLAGPDHVFALEPNGLRQMVRAIRECEKKIKQGKRPRVSRQLLGYSQRKTYELEKYIREFTYRGVFATCEIKRGEKLTKKNIAVLRPGKKKKGLEPKYYWLLTKGYKAVRDISAASGVTWKDVLTK